MRSGIRFGISMLLAVASITVAGCGGNGKSTTPVSTTYTVGGAVSGLTGAGLVLQNNGGNSLTVSSSATSFTFSSPVSNNSPYSVTVLTQPAGETCTVTSGSGKATANVTNVAVACVAMYTIGGAITGLTETGLVLQNNGSDNLTVDPNAATYIFATSVTGGAYSVKVLAQPLGENCTVANGSGKATANVTNVNVTCTQAYTVNGTIAGLTATGLVLQDNGGDNLTVSANATSFTFAAPVLSGAAYSVTVLTQPANQGCTVANGSGTTVANVTNISIVCVGDWTWMGGSSVVGFTGGQAGVYGSLGTPGTANVPGGRQQATTWSDGSGGAWLFGGYGNDSAATAGQLNDLWKFDPTLGTAGEWTWIAGSNIAPPGAVSDDPNGQQGVYGVLGTPSSTTVPGGREQAASWKDAAGNLWLFGGMGLDGRDADGYLNDLWKFDPKLGEWTWMGGSSTVPSFPSNSVYTGWPGVYGTLGTAASTNVPGGRYGAIAWPDASGNLWLYGGQGFDSAGMIGYLNDLWEYTPGANGTPGNWIWMAGSTTVPPSNYPGDENGQPGIYGTLGTAASTNYPGGRSAGASWTDVSGHFWLFGGLGADSAGTPGYLNDIWMFDPKSGPTGAWTWMAGSDTLPSTNSGSYPGQPGVYGVLGTTSSANVPGARFSTVSWMDASGDLWIFGGQGFDWTGTTGLLSDLWKYSPKTSQWTWMAGSNTVPPSTNLIFENGQPGVYGILGTPAPGNTPGGRLGGAPWVDASGNLWLFGGQGFDGVDVEGNLSDVWRYEP